MGMTPKHWLDLKSSYFNIEIEEWSAMTKKIQAKNHPRKGLSIVSISLGTKNKLWLSLLINLFLIVPSNLCFLLSLTITKSFQT
jgi:hypothetical protein